MILLVLFLYLDSLSSYAIFWFISFSLFPCLIPAVSISIPKLDEEAKDNGEFMPYIRGAKLPGEFEVEGIHFHWGDKNNRGAEHVVNDIRYTMEMHIVHRNKKYKTLTEALDYADGGAVLGFFFNVSMQTTMLASFISRVHRLKDM